MKRLLLPLLLLTASPAAAKSISLIPGQTVRVGGVTLTLLRVQDDRCPPRAYCIMAGNVTASVLVVRGKAVRMVRPQLLGRAVETPAGALKLAQVSRRETGKTPRLTFELKE